MCSSDLSIDPVSMTLKSMLSQPVSVWHQVDTQGRCLILIDTFRERIVSAFRLLNLFQIPVPMPPQVLQIFFADYPSRYLREFLPHSL